MSEGAPGCPEKNGSTDFDSAPFVPHVFFRRGGEAARKNQPPQAMCPVKSIREVGEGICWVPRQGQTIRKGGTQSYGSPRDRQATERLVHPGACRARCQCPGPQSPPFAARHGACSS